MPPRPLHRPVASAAPSAPRPLAATTPNASRQFKVLQSSRAPAQLTLFTRPLPLRQA
jgi:hypothetical protein